MIPFFILLPLGSAFLAALAGRLHTRVAEGIACASCAALALMSLMLMPAAAGRAVPLVFRLGGFAAPAGIPLVVDALAAFMLVIANGIACAVAVYSAGYMRRYTDTWKYYTLLMVMVAGVNGVILSGDIFNLFVYLEVASIAAYALVAFGTEAEALEAAFKYAVMSSVASGFMLLGIGLLYSFTSTLNFADMGAAIAALGPSAHVVRFVSVLILLGLGLKAALAPFHAWMPDAYAKAPATVPALSSGILVKALGVYALARIFFNVFGMSGAASAILIGCGLLSMIVGSVMAFGQENLRRLLGYSSISQIGYIFLGLGIGTPLSVAAALFHLLNHSVAKSLLFLATGEIETARDADREATLRQARPVAAATTLCGVFSVCGIPPFAGFWSKLLIIIACVQAGRPGLALVAAIVSMLTIAYYCKAFVPLVSGKGAGGVSRAAWQPVSGSLALVVLAFVALAGGLFLLPGARWFITHAAAGLTKGTAYATVLLGAFK